MSANIDNILKVSKDYPQFFNVRDHLINGTRLSIYLSDVAFASKKVICESGKNILFSDGESLMSIVVCGTAEILFKFKLAKKLGVDFMNSKIIKDSLKKLSDFLNYITRGGLDSFLYKEIGYSEFMKIYGLVELSVPEIVEYFEDRDVEKSLFVYQILRFNKYGNFDVFEKDWMCEAFFEKEVEIMANSAIDKLGKFCSSREVDFFPEFGNEFEIVASGDLLIGNKLLNFCAKCEDGYLKRQSVIMKSCYLLGEYYGKTISRCFVFGLRDGKMIEFN